MQGQLDSTRTSVRAEADGLRASQREIAVCPGATRPIESGSGETAREGIVMADSPRPRSKLDGPRAQPTETIKAAETMRTNAIERLE